MKTNILFVCLGNICRSPSAETIMNHLIELKGLQNKYYVDSAGIIGFHAGTGRFKNESSCSKARYTITSIFVSLILLPIFKNLI